MRKPRAAQRDRARHPGDRAAAGLAGRRRRGRGVRVLLSGHRLAARRLGAQPRHPDGAGAHHAAPAIYVVLNLLADLLSILSRHGAEDGDDSTRPSSRPSTWSEARPAIASAAAPALPVARHPAHRLAARARAGDGRRHRAVALFGPCSARTSSSRAEPRATERRDLRHRLPGPDVFSRVLYGGLSVLWISAAATLLGVVARHHHRAGGRLRRATGSTTCSCGSTTWCSPSRRSSSCCWRALGDRPELWLIVLLVGASHAPRVARVVRGAALGDRRPRLRHGRGGARREALAGHPGRGAAQHDRPLLVEAGLRLTYSIGLSPASASSASACSRRTADWGLMINENRLSMPSSRGACWPRCSSSAVLTVGTNLMADGIARWPRSALTRGPTRVGDAPRPRTAVRRRHRPARRAHRARASTSSTRSTSSSAPARSSAWSASPAPARPPSAWRCSGTSGAAGGIGAAGVRIEGRDLSSLGDGELRHLRGGDRPTSPRTRAPR